MQEDAETPLSLKAGLGLGLGSGLELTLTARALLLARRLGKRRGGEACGSDYGGRATWFELGLGLEPT